MSVLVERELCHGCPAARQAPCERACPGDLLARRRGKVEVREASLCWDCASCVKVCPRGALSLALPLALGGRGARLAARARAAETLWRLRYPGGREEEFVLPARAAAPGGREE